MNQDNAITDVLMLSEQFKTHPTEAQKNEAHLQAEKFSQSVFNDPQTFLRTLRDDALTIAPKGQLTQKNLAAYAADGGDPEIRRVAKVAAAHFDAIEKVSESFDAMVPSWQKGSHTTHNTFSDHPANVVNADDLTTAIDFASGNLGYQIFNARFNDGAAAVLGGAIAVGLGFGTAALLELPPLAGYCGAATAVVGGASVALGYDAFKVGGEIREIAHRDQQILAAIPEINGGKQK